MERSPAHPKMPPLYDRQGSSILVVPAHDPDRFHRITFVWLAIRVLKPFSPQMWEMGRHPKVLMCSLRRPALNMMPDFRSPNIMPNGGYNLAAAIK